MIKFFLDTNIFDKLDASEADRQLLIQAVQKGEVVVETCVTVGAELTRSPHLHWLNELPIHVVGNATPVSGLMIAGDHLGDADHYFDHKGESGSVNDALIAGAAEYHRATLVSEDHRMITRQAKLAKNPPIPYDQFIAMMKTVVM